MQVGAGLRPTALGVGAGSTVGVLLAAPTVAHKLGDAPPGGVLQDLESGPARAAAGVTATFLLPASLSVAAAATTAPQARMALLGAAMGVEMGWWGTRSLEELAPGA